MAGLCRVRRLAEENWECGNVLPEDWTVFCHIVDCLTFYGMWVDAHHSLQKKKILLSLVSFKYKESMTGVIKSFECLLHFNRTKKSGDLFRDDKEYKVVLQLLCLLYHRVLEVTPNEVSVTSMDIKKKYLDLIRNLQDTSAVTSDADFSEKLLDGLKRRAVA